VKAELGTLRGLDAHQQALIGLVEHQQELEAQADGQAMTVEQKADFLETGESRREVEAVIEELKVRQAEIAEAISAGQVEETTPTFATSFNVKKSPENVYDLSAYRSRAASVEELPALYRDGAMRVIENATFLTAPDQVKAKDQVAKLLAKHKDDDGGRIARRIIGTDNPQYIEAYAEYFRKGGMAGLTPQRQAILQTYSDADGGIAIPFTLDPTFVNTSDGTVNPWRAISRVETITGKSWQGVITEGVTAAYVGERTTTGASDAAPQFDDTPATPVRADVAIDVSIEYLEDYGSASLVSEVGNMVQIAKDDLESEKFALGDGTGEPEGIVRALIDDTTSIVQTATDNVYVLADIDALIASLPPRFRSRAVVVGNLAILQLSAGFGTAGQPGNSIYDPLARTLRGYRVYESSFMDDAATDAKEILLVGDFKAGFIIVDRVGLSTEILPQYDANARPTGGKIIYAHWRNTSKMLFPNAFRLLQVK
jgi:HK97 family phage major capsid protein